MQTVARIIISDTAGTLAEQVDRRPRAEALVPRFTPVRPRQREVPVGVEIPRRDLIAFNGIGGFTQDGREYVITTTAERPTPAPWANVIANPYFGMVMTESGGAYTWCENAQSYRLTPWYNDWIRDASGEAFYIRDEESGRFWSPTPLPARGDALHDAAWVWVHDLRIFGGWNQRGDEHVCGDGCAGEVCGAEAAKQLRASAAGVDHGVFGTGAGRAAAGKCDARGYGNGCQDGGAFARNSYGGEFAQRIAFLECSEALRTVTGDRTEFLGRNGGPGRPACMSRTRLSGRVGANFDPCAAMQVMIDLPDGREREVAFIIGSGRDAADARTLIGRFRGVDPARDAQTKVWEYWNHALGAVHVETPDAAVNYLANGWLLYQTMACRFLGAAGFISRAGPLGSATSFRTCARLCMRSRRFCGRIWCGALRGSFARETCSTGGTHQADAGFGRESRTIICGCRMRRAGISRRWGIRGCWMRRRTFWRGVRLSRTRTATLIRRCGRRNRRRFMSTACGRSRMGLSLEIMGCR